MAEAALDHRDPPVLFRALVAQRHDAEEAAAVVPPRSHIREEVAGAGGRLPLEHLDLDVAQLGFDSDPTHV